MSPRNKWYCIKRKLLYNEWSNCFYCGIAIACWYWREMTAYRIVGNFCKLVEKKDLCRRSFTALLLVVPKDASHYNFADKSFANSHKTSKSQKFLPSKVSYYMVSSCITEREITVWLLISCSHAGMGTLKWSRCWLKNIIVMWMAKIVMVTLHSMKLAGKYPFSLLAC